MRFLITRPQPDCRTTADKLRSLGHEAIEEPMLSMLTLLPEVLPDRDFGGIIVTSSRTAQLLKDHPAAQYLRNVPVYAVGDRTANEMQAAGWNAVFSASGSSQELLRIVEESKPSSPLLYVAARNRAGDLEMSLDAAGFETVLVEAYGMEMVRTLSESVAGDLEAGRYNGVLIYSARTAEAFLRAVQQSGLERFLAGLHVFAISHQAGKPLQEKACVVAASAPTEEALLNIALYGR